jgi:hypothetical protein
MRKQRQDGDTKDEVKEGGQLEERSRGPHNLSEETRRRSRQKIQCFELRREREKERSKEGDICGKYCVLPNWGGRPRSRGHIRAWARNNVVQNPIHSYGTGGWKWFYLWQILIYLFACQK